MSTNPQRSWIEAEIDLADARLAALNIARTAIANVAPWLDALERQQVEATRATLELRQHREQTLRDQHEATLRRLSEQVGA